MKINLRPSFLPQRPRGRGADPFPKAYKPYLIASLAALVLSLFLLAVVVVLAFAYFGHAGTPLWVLILGGLAVLGIGLGFAGFLGLMALAGWSSWREARRVQVLPPER
jgi:hypothetical protein